MPRPDSRFFAAASIAAAVLFAPAPARAHDDVMVGLRAGYYSDVQEPFVGGELLFKAFPSVYFNPNLEYVFVDGGSFLTLNADFHYDFPTRSRTYLWLGAGLGVVRVDPDGPGGSNSDTALNLLGGAGVRTRGGLVPYVQGKVVVKDDALFSLAFGLRF